MNISKLSVGLTLTLITSPLLFAQGNYVEPGADPTELARRGMCPERITYRHLETTHDKCSRQAIVILGRNRHFELRNGGRVCFVPPSEEFYWHCGGARESTTCDGTNYVEAYKAESGRNITWHCYRR